MKLRHFALAACLFLSQLGGTSFGQQAVSAAPAGAPVYNVEIIVFRTTATLGSPENWGSEATQAPAVPLSAEGETVIPDSNTAAAAGSVTAAPASTRLVRLLTPAEWQLADLDARLKASANYVPIAHVGWAQTATPWGSHESMSLQQLGIDSPGLSGTVTLERGQFLHLGLALNLTIANPPTGLGAPPQTTFVLSDNHRVKFYERNYYDAPAFGVIALVVPAQGPRRAGR